MEIVEDLLGWQNRYKGYLKDGGVQQDDIGKDYVFIENKTAPFTPARRALPMLNLALISSAGAYIDGTEPFNLESKGGDVTFREIPIEVEAEDLKYSARGYDPTAVQQDRNAQIPIERLLEYEANSVIGQLNHVWWSFNGFIPDAARVVETLAPKIVERVKRYEVQAALLIPASRLCHQSIALVARALEAENIPTMMIGIDRAILESVKPPRAGLYAGEFGCVAGKPNWKEYQLRVLDEALRLIEPIDQPSIRRLVVNLESEVEKDRGEK